jgi:pimeloyl-ACP methyl ester carboxylesterase
MTAEVKIDDAKANPAVFCPACPERQMTSGDEAVSHVIRSDDGLNLHASVTSGSGASCLLIHGYGEGSYVWTEFGRAIAGRYRVIRIDLRGHGDSEWSRDGRYGLDDYARDAARVVEGLCEDGLFIIGHSLGAKIGLRLAAQFPRRTWGLVIVDASPELAPGIRSKVQQDVANSRKLFQSVGHYALELRARRPFLSPELAFRLATDALRQCENGFQVKSDPAIARPAPVTSADDAMRSMLSEVRCPVLVVRGATSAVLSLKAANDMMGLLHDGRIKIVERAGHGVMTDNPAGFAAAVRAFLDETSTLDGDHRNGVSE